MPVFSFFWLFMHPIMEPIKISRDGVYKLIKNINPSKATGPDIIAGRVLKENIDISKRICIRFELTYNRIGGVMSSVLASSEVDGGFIGGIMSSVLASSVNKLNEGQ
jgi:hypothetical protein